MFFDGALDDADALAGIDHRLREIAGSGAMVRRAHLAATEDLALIDTGSDHGGRPRAVIAAGPDGRLLRAVLDAVCPVPFVAWPHTGLPGWAGPLDLVVMISTHGVGSDEIAAAAEARRRGCSLLMAAPRPSPLAEAVAGRSTIVLPSGGTEEAAAQAVPVLEALHLLGLGPAVDAEAVADALDQVAMRCAPSVPADENTAKELALALADAVPVVWGGSVLAARAARRVAEAWRTATGRPVVAGDVAQILPILAAAPEPDVFADPFEDSAATPALPVLVLLDDGVDGPGGAEARATLEDAAEVAGVRVQNVVAVDGPDIARFGALVITGRFTAAYLALGLGRPV